MSKSQALAHAPKHDIAEMPDFGEDAGLGAQNTRADELQTPFLAIAQSNSKILKRGDAKFVAEARPGDLYNTVTQEVYNGEEGVEIMPCFRQSLYTLWTPIEEGGGFHGTRDIDDQEIAALIREQGKFPAERIRRGFDKALINSDGHQVVEQVNLYVIYGGPAITEENFSHAVLAFKSTSIGVHRSFYTAAKAIRYGNVEPPFWAHRWNLKIVGVSDGAQDWFNPHLALANAATVRNPRPALVQIGSPQYQAAKAFYQMLNDGKAQANYAAAGDAVEDDAAPF